MPKRPHTDANDSLLFLTARTNCTRASNTENFFQGIDARKSVTYVMRLNCYPCHEIMPRACWRLRPRDRGRSSDFLSLVRWSLRKRLFWRDAKTNTRDARATLNVMARRLSNTRIALPLDVCHFARHNIDFEGAETADATFFSLDGNSIVSGRQRNPKTSL